jgi:hypothetical protein
VATRPQAASRGVRIAALLAAVVLVTALAALGWGLTRAMRRPLLAGCAVLGGSVVAFLAVFVVLYGLNLSGNLGR